MKSRLLTVSLFSLFMMIILICFYVCKNKGMGEEHSNNLSCTENKMEETFDPIFESVVKIDGEFFEVYTDNDIQNTVASTSVCVIEDAEQFFQQHPEAATLSGG